MQDTVVLLPFASGNVAEVEVTSYEARQSDKPVRAYFAHDVTPQMADTLKTGADIAYRLGYERGEIAGESFGVSCTLRGFPAGVAVKGESAGLAMALAVYTELTQREVGRVAATGVLSSLKGDGKIGRVLGIGQKLEGVLGRLGSGDMILYPRANSEDVSENLKARYQREGIALVGVESVGEAIAILSKDHKKIAANDSAPYPAKDEIHRLGMAKKSSRLSRAVVLMAVTFIIIVGAVAGREIWQRQNDSEHTIEKQAVNFVPAPARKPERTTTKYVFE